MFMPCRRSPRSSQTPSASFSRVGLIGRPGNTFSGAIGSFTRSPSVRGLVYFHARAVEGGARDPDPLPDRVARDRDGEVDLDLSGAVSMRPLDPVPQREEKPRQCSPA